MSRICTPIILTALAACTISLLGTEGALPPARAAGAASFSDGYACYAGQFSGFRRPDPLTLADLLARRSGSMPIDPPATVCAPATSGRLPSAKKGYLVCYPTPPTELAVDVRITSDAIGSLKLTKKSRRDLVCVESARVDRATTTQRSDSRRFVCYRSALRGTGSRTVRVRDEVRGTETGAASSPYRGCAAAGKRLPSESSPAYLVCSPVTSETPGGSIVLRNVYGYVKGVLGARTTICAEATRAT